MNILIIGAMAEEISHLCKLCNASYENKLFDISYWQGKVDQHDVIICQSGIGKVNAATTTSIMLYHFKPDLVLNIGSAGGIDEDVQIADIIIATELNYHDVDVTAFGYKKGQIPDMPERFQPDQTLLSNVMSYEKNLSFKSGSILSGDSFISSSDALSIIKASFPNALALDMESASIAQVCHKLNTKYLIFRTISDHANEQSDTDFSTQLKDVSDKLANALVEVIKNF